MTIDPGQKLDKTTLNSFDIACVVIGGIIGIGIFFTPSEVAAVVESTDQVIAAWSIGGAMIILGALVYARLSQLAPGPGGVFEYLRSAFGRMPAFLYGWCNLLIIQSGALAVVGLVMVDNLQRALAVEPFSDLQRTAIASFAIAALTAINALGLKLGKSVQIVLTVIKVSAVFAVVLIAVFAEGRTPSATPVAPKDVPFFEAMGLAILPVLFACGGWQHGSFVSTVARRPLRDVPIGIVAGVLVVVVAYLTINLAYLDLLGLEGAAQSKTIAVDAVGAAMSGDQGDVVARLFGALIVISALGVMNTICLAPPYVLQAMATQNLFFPVVATVHARYGTPLFAIVVQGTWSILLLWGTQAIAWTVDGLDPLRFLLNGVVFVDWMFYGTCGVALLALIQRRGFARGDGWYYVVALLFALSAFAVTVGAVLTRAKPSIAGLTVLLLGVVAFARFRRPGQERSGL